MSPEERARHVVMDAFTDYAAPLKHEHLCRHIADAIRAAVEETRREMMLPCAACAERGEVVTRRMNTEPGECPHGYAFDCCTQCHEAFHAGRAEEREACALLVRDGITNLMPIQQAGALLQLVNAIRAGGKKAAPSFRDPEPPERGAP